MAGMNESVHRRIAAAIHWLVAHHAEQPSLAEIAASAGMSPAHFSRSFQRWVGVSPKRFLEHLTLQDVKHRLAQGEGLFDAGIGAGLSGPGRVHDHFVKLEAVTPGEYLRAGEGIAIDWGVHASPFGDVLLAVTPRGICFTAFLHDGTRTQALDALAAAWPGASLRERPGATERFAGHLFDGEPVRLHVRGTNFQVQVWRALLRIPEGALAAYGDVARTIGKPDAVRAVASAVGANPVSFLVPCHRVIRASGALGGYRWGLTCKHALLAWEYSRLRIVT